MPLTLGREGLKRMEATKRKEQAETMTTRAALQQRLGDVQTWLDTGRKGELADGTPPDRAGELPQLPEREAELGQVRETINLLSTPERAVRQQRLNELETQQRSVNDRVAVLRDRNGKFELTVRPEREGLVRAEEDAREGRLEVEASRVELGRRFSGLLNAELASQRDQLRKEFPKWTECFVQAQARAGHAERLLPRRETNGKPSANASPPRATRTAACATRSISTSSRPPTKATRRGPRGCACWTRWNWQSPASSPATASATGNGGWRRMC